MQAITTILYDFNEQTGPAACYTLTLKRVNRIRLRLVLSVLLLFAMALKLNAQQSFTLSGYVRDSASAESINGAVVSVKGGSFSVTTNQYGFFSLTLPKGNIEINASANGYENHIQQLLLDTHISLDIMLISRTKGMNVVNIRAGRNDNVRKIDISTQSINSQTIKKIPAFLGEADVIKAVQLLPGVSTVGEGASGFNVRGGAIDQNLVLMDEAPVFNSAHLFGFFSIFNPDGVKDVQLVKGGIPAQYGGRLSSTLDVRMKEGNKKKFQANGGVGTIFSRLTMEGPLAKNKASFIVAGRRSYIDALAKPFLKSNLTGSQFYFYDLTAKINYSRGRDHYFISSYFGDDAFSAPNAFGVKWGNSTVTARWNHVFNKKLFANFTYYYSRYRYNIEFKNRDLTFNWKSYIISNSAKVDFNYYFTPKHQLTFGSQSVYYNFRPGNAVATSKNGSFNFSLPEKYAFENAIYVGEEFNSSGKFSYRLGFRLSSWHYLGKGTAYYFQDASLPNGRKTLDYTREFDNNQTIASYINPEPRFGFKYQINQQGSIKGGYNRMVQNLHLISNTSASVPFDVWQPTTNNILPEKADQYTIGYFRNIGPNGDFETSFETYYKRLQNQVDYVDGADLLLNELLEGELLRGDGRAYGAEFYIRKTTGNLTGWISYTLSRSERQVNGVNNNEWFPVRFDRLHNLYVVLQYKISEKWDASANFVFSSGTPTTFYSNQYSVQGYIVPDIGSNARNNVRNPNYHRMDVSATYTKKKTKKWESNWVFSVYNAYNRRNPFSIYFATNYQDKNINQAIRYSVIGSFVPAVSYNFKWN
jgi:hypothetical protein